jgi:hypothetical protein
MKTNLKAVLLVFTAAAILGSSQTAHAFATIGVIDCGTWVKQRQGKNQEATLSQIWLNGLLTGLNIMGAAQGRKDFLSSIKSTEQLYLWLDNYCRNNPMNDLALGGLALALELSKK